MSLKLNVVKNELYNNTLIKTVSKIVREDIRSVYLRGSLGCLSPPPPLSIFYGQNREHFEWKSGKIGIFVQKNGFKAPL